MMPVQRAALGSAPVVPENVLLLRFSLRPLRDLFASFAVQAFDFWVNRENLSPQEGAKNMRKIIAHPVTGYSVTGSLQSDDPLY